MFKTDKQIYEIILAVNMLCIVLALCCSIQYIILSAGNFTNIASQVFVDASLLFAIFYIFKGYTKDAARYYKYYGIFMLITLAVVFTNAGDNAPLISIILSAVNFVIMLVLVLAENFGKARSLILCVMQIVLIIPAFILELNNPTSLYYLFSIFVLFCLYAIMTYAKYLDKAERGSK